MKNESVLCINCETFRTNSDPIVINKLNPFKMKKILLVFGIAALLTACGGNKPANEPAQEEGTEIQMEGTEDQQEVIPADTTSVETPAEPVTTPPAQ